MRLASTLNDIIELTIYCERFSLENIRLMILIFASKLNYWFYLPFVCLAIKINILYSYWKYFSSSDPDCTCKVLHFYQSLKDVTGLIYWLVYKMFVNEYSLFFVSLIGIWGVMIWVFQSRKFCDLSKQSCHMHVGQTRATWIFAYVVIYKCMNMWAT